MAMLQETEYEEKKFTMVVYRINETEFSILSLNSTFGKPKQYVLKWVGYKWICSCPDYAKHSEEIDYACKHIEAMFKAVKKIVWNRDGIEVEVVRRYRFNGNGRNGRNGRSVEAETVKQNVEVTA
jgi:predicted nucleic acid-binding Zn finger protein